jgi:hypothetical protein
LALSLPRFRNRVRFRFARSASARVRSPSRASCGPLQVVSFRTRSAHVRQRARSAGVRCHVRGKFTRSLCARSPNVRSPSFLSRSAGPTTRVFRVHMIRPNDALACCMGPRVFLVGKATIWRAWRSPRRPSNACFQSSYLCAKTVLGAASVVPCVSLVRK